MGLNKIKKINQDYQINQGLLYTFPVFIGLFHLTFAAFCGLLTTFPPIFVA